MKHIEIVRVPCLLCPKTAGIVTPTGEHPGDGYPGPAVLRLEDLSDDQMTMLLMWRDRDEELVALEMALGG